MMNFLNHSKWASVPYTGVDAIFNVNRFLPSKLRVESRVCSKGLYCCVLGMGSFKWRNIPQFSVEGRNISNKTQVEHGSMTY